MIQCPYCLASVEPQTRQQGRVTQYVCPGCEQPLARDFVESKAPNSTIGLIGFSGHGKTVYIHYLFYLLSHLKNEWPDYYYTSLDDHTDRILYELVTRLRKESVLPDSTPANFPLPALLLHHNFPGHGDRFVTVYDTAGDVFEQTQTITEQGRYVAHADTVFFLVSLADLGESWGDRLELLLQKYVRAARDHMRVELKQQQRLVMVFTKADLLLGADAERPLPKELVEYLHAGTYEAYRALGSGTDKTIREASGRIERWLGKSGCRAFVSMARDNFKDVAFTLVSATGAAPVGQKLPTRLEAKDPKRVLDPLLWALERSWAPAEPPKPPPEPPPPPPPPLPRSGGWEKRRRRLRFIAALTAEFASIAIGILLFVASLKCCSLQNDHLVVHGWSKYAARRGDRVFADEFPYRNFADLEVVAARSDRIPIDISKSKVKLLLSGVTWAEAELINWDKQLTLAAFKSYGNSMQGLMVLIGDREVYAVTKQVPFYKKYFVVGWIGFWLMLTIRIALCIFALAFPMLVGSMFASVLNAGFE